MKIIGFWELCGSPLQNPQLKVAACNWPQVILSLKYGHWIGTNYIDAMLSKKSRGMVSVVSEYF